MRVIATAGHVDHGKSTLVRALTGVDPDRLAEEKRRGLTIELGFAGTKLPSGEQIAFVDVPGHRRFIGNMLTGLGPAPAVMFVVAADQGWQAQSDEHLAAVDALGIEHGLLVLARCGRAGAIELATTRHVALERISTTSLGNVEVVETDAIEGRGLGELRCALDRLVASLPPIDRLSPVRFWIDRSFSIKGTGTVVTGTLGSGTLSIGDELAVGPRRGVVRSLEVLGEHHDRVEPVSRVAVALRGLSTEQAPRGATLLSPGAYAVSDLIDVRRRGGLPWGEASPEVSVHIGTAATTAYVRPFDELHARLTLAEPLPLRLGDRLIVRDDSAGRIHCGATVLDIDPLPVKRRGDSKRRSAQLGHWTPGGAADLVADRGVIRAATLAAMGASGWSEWRSELSERCMTVTSGWALAPGTVTGWINDLRDLLDRDAKDRLSAGVPVSSAAAALGAPAELIPALAGLAGARIAEGRVVGAAHGGELGAAEAGVETLRKRLSANPFDAPEAGELADLGLGARQLATAAKRGVLLRLPGEVVLLPDGPARAMRELVRLPQPFTTSEARETLRTTRRIVIPLLEHLDSRGWTTRIDATHRVVSGK